jgi:hypothetical protein
MKVQSQFLEKKDSNLKVWSLQLISTFVFSTLFFLFGCGIIQPTGGGDDKRNDDDKVYPFSALGIPKGHLPPPGECKIWYPNKPAGQQGPPQSCASALRQAPLGAWVITHQGNRFKVNIFSQKRPGIIDEVKYYHSSN